MDIRRHDPCIAPASVSVGLVPDANIALHSPDRFGRHFILAARKYFSSATMPCSSLPHSAPAYSAAPAELDKSYQNLIRKMPLAENNPPRPAISFDSGGID
ncbi:hypothetical protein ACXHXG_11030 [Rhizobium sp. LEGMi198b]|uniref:hypothetical protein n=1 Tax=unclassified Rhizobium TaxID=2613769 RepID=UPI00131A5861|nr:MULTISPECIES: hypothetical protein [Rhizobium]UWU20049.1 hypothetical protein N2601_12135 [Rhizobium tropici]